MHCKDLGAMETPEMPGLAEPVYEVKRTRLSPPSSGAYEAQAVTEVPPVTGTHWTNDGFERRVRARCEAPQVLLTCHRCSSGLPVGGSECAKATGGGDELQRKERMGVVTVEKEGTCHCWILPLPFSRVAGWLSGRSSHGRVILLTCSSGQSPSESKLHPFT